MSFRIHSISIYSIHFHGFKLRIKKILIHFNLFSFAGLEGKGRKMNCKNSSKKNRSTDSTMRTSAHWVRTFSMSHIRSIDLFFLAEFLHQFLSFLSRRKKYRPNALCPSAKKSSHSIRLHCYCANFMLYSANKNCTSVVLNLYSIKQNALNENKLYCTEIFDSTL